MLQLLTYFTAQSSDTGMMPLDIDHFCVCFWKYLRETHMIYEIIGDLGYYETY